MPEAESVPPSARVLIDAGVFIAALLKGDPRSFQNQANASTLKTDANACDPRFWRRTSP